MSRSKVTVLKTRPDTVLDDIDRLLGLAEVDRHLARGPGTILALRKRGFADLACVQNDTVVTNPFKGERLNRYTPVFEKHRIPVLFNFDPAHVKWVPYKPKAKMLALDKVFPEGIHLPEYF